ncbi:hypothetical protein SAMN06295909_0337 [Plantibacter sp. VKM Ac-1784]|uniref:Integral membrane protein n=1 Tax=Plantibacter elymi (nom. nud.) TaxID=199708 RepID=A0ABY1R8P6_9MICO|nr:hypothetical protein [Plantibacter sp. VKM Ac-1784]SMQ59684.1 hypothetical protein SAMN06295909_0337 [Plantibacter sp. VKM Ac-1784]
MTDYPSSDARNDFVTFDALRAEAVEQPVRRGAGAWGFFGTVAIVIGALLIPVALVSTWADTMLRDTDAFVDTLAPLATDPAVQAFVGDQALAALESQVDLDAAAAVPADLAATLSLPPAISEVLGAIGGDTADALREVLRRNVAEFATAWTEALRVTHEQLVAGVSGSQGAVIDVSAEQGLGVQLGPIVSATRTWLVDAGFGFAAAIPDVDRVVDVVPASQVAPVLDGIRVIETAAGWSPWLAIGLLALGVILLWLGRRNPSRTVAGAAIGVLLAAGLTLILLGAARLALVFAVSVAIPGGVGDAAASLLLGPPTEVAWSVLWVSLAVAVLAFVSAALRLPERVARGVRTVRRPLSGTNA